MVKEEIRAGLMKGKKIDRCYMDRAWDAELTRDHWDFGGGGARGMTATGFFDGEEVGGENKNRYYPVNNTYYRIEKDQLNSISKEERTSLTHGRRKYFCEKLGKINDHKCTLDCFCEVGTNKDLHGNCRISTKVRGSSKKTLEAQESNSRNLRNERDGHLNVSNMNSGTSKGSGWYETGNQNDTKRQLNALIELMDIHMHQGDVENQVEIVVGGPNTKDESLQTDKVVDFRYSQPILEDHNEEKMARLPNQLSGGQKATLVESMYNNSTHKSFAPPSDCRACNEPPKKVKNYAPKVAVSGPKRFLIERTYQVDKGKKEYNDYMERNYANMLNPHATIPDDIDKFDMLGPSHAVQRYYDLTKGDRKLTHEEFFVNPLYDDEDGEPLKEFTHGKSSRSHGADLTGHEQSETEMINQNLYGDELDRLFRYLISFPPNPSWRFFDIRNLGLEFPATPNPQKTLKSAAVFTRFPKNRSHREIPTKYFFFSKIFLKFTL